MTRITSLLLLTYGTAICQAAKLGVLNNARHETRRTCTVKPGGSNATDDAPAIVEAFQECGHGGKVAFLNTTYFVNSVMNTTDIDDCEVDLQGTLLWSTNISYWLANSLPVGYQNQSSAWFFGGNNIRFDGHGYGTLNGNGDVWYSYIHDQSNYPGRPHAITFSGLNDSTITGLRFIRSQMWTMSIIYSHNDTLDDIYINNLSSGGSSSSNTDGADTFYSSFIRFNNWTVINGDDSISLKANSTDITITNSHFYDGLGIAMGSIGQYKDVFETIERVQVDNIYCSKTTHAVYFKTWTGDQVGYPPNGGGGGLGYASNMQFSNLFVSNITGAPISISQCTTFSGASGNCTDSKFQLQDLFFYNLTGTLTSSTVASLQCSAVKPCEDVGIYGAKLEVVTTGAMATRYLCGNVMDTQGFNCTGSVCVGSSATGGC